MFWVLWGTYPLLFAVCFRMKCDFSKCRNTKSLNGPMCQPVEKSSVNWYLVLSELSQQFFFCLSAKRFWKWDWRWSIFKSKLKKAWSKIMHDFAQNYFIAGLQRWKEVNAQTSWVDFFSIKFKVDVQQRKWNASIHRYHSKMWKRNLSVSQNHFGCEVLRYCFPSIFVALLHFVLPGPQCLMLCFRIPWKSHWKMLSWLQTPNQKYLKSSWGKSVSVQYSNKL